MSNVCPAASLKPTRHSGWRPRLRCIAVGVTAIAAEVVAAPHAQAQVPVGGRSEVFAGSDLESYLRYLQTAGKSRDYPWGIRSFSPAEIDALAASDSAHPWASRFDLQRRPRTRGFQWDYVRPKLTFYLNSAFPYGGNDGAVWQGKGLTTAFQGGLSARWGPFSMVLAPVAFRSENQSFTLMDNGESGRLRFADGQFPIYIDRPQRFGVDPYSRFDLGQSTLRFDWFGVAAGISTANQWWGPTDQYPYLLGNNAAGFPHIFLGTSHPLDLWIAKLHTHYVTGQLDQTAFSSVTGPSYFVSFGQPGKRRFMAGLIATIEPRGAPGLEIGGARFFHAAADAVWFSRHNLALPIEHLFKRGLPVQTDTLVFGGNRAVKENQLASIFLRWAPAGTGFEVYGEFGREDHSLDKRDLILEPDHSGSTNFGFRKAWLSPRLMQAVRGEVFTYEASSGSRTRGEGQTYVHGVLRQGHTERGQMLGANVGGGSGSAQLLAYDRYTTSGRMTAFVSREVLHEERPPVQYSSGPPLERPVDVLNSLGAEASRFIGPFDFMARTTLTVDFNRYFRADRANANFALSVRQAF
jgi:hypothetical protein